MRDMTLKTFSIELGLGVDLHGQDPTRAAVKAVKNAVERVSLPGLRQIAGITDWNSQVFVEVLLGVPPEMAGRVDVGRVQEVLPLGRKTVQVVPGGLLASSGATVPSMGDVSDQAVAVVAAIAVKVDVP